MKLTKEDIDKVRHIEGFPIAKDDDIILRADSPKYTGCPNAYLKEFIAKYGTSYDEETDTYHKLPYSEDVTEDKHDLIYNIHSYHTKVPPKAIMKYILHYTNPGDVIFDGFCGSGMAGVAAQLCEDFIGDNSGRRYPILNDISSIATFIAHNYCSPIDKIELKDIMDDILEIESNLNSLYITHHYDSGNADNFPASAVKGNINYVVWSDVFYCPDCNKELVYYDAAVKQPDNITLKTFNCPSCNRELTKPMLVRKEKTLYDYILKDYITTSERVPVLINYSVNTTRYTKRVDKYDLNTIYSIQEELNTILQEIPCQKIIQGDKTNELIRNGIIHVHQLYSLRTQYILAKLFSKFKNNSKKMFLLTSALPKLTILNRFMPEHKSRALVGPMAGTYYLPPLSVENNVFKQLKFQLNKLKNLKYTPGDYRISLQSTSDLSNLPDNCIDYVFIDPPFGSNLMYSELNFIWDAWLNIQTNSVEEAIINKTQKKDTSEYQDLMYKCFSEINRILKPNRWLTLEFHNSKNVIWNIIQENLLKSGFIIADIRILSKSKKTINQSISYSAVNEDLVISAYKPKESFQRKFINNENSLENVWRFIEQHLEMLPITLIENDQLQPIKERENFILFDRMIAYHIVNALNVPIDSTEFYKGLDERFAKRDNMYFLIDQINEYDEKRLLFNVNDIQLSLVITDEKTAIAWLHHELKVPQSYSELQPKFLQEIRSINKYEQLPELLNLLDDNFIQDETSKWYIPDITKIGDINKLREKRLLKDFEEYLKGKGKLKIFRAEAVRAGFAKLWKQKDYASIIKVANRLPEQVIQEDDKLLMYYDISLSRVE